MIFPYVVAFLVAILAGLYLPADRLGVNRFIWFVVVAAVSTAVMIPADRLVRQFIPLTGLLAISLGFPDAAPSRFKVAMRSSTTAQIQRRITRALATDIREADLDRNQYLLDLVAALTTHDRLTRGHCERVRVYATLMGSELRLSRSDQQKLHWVALLHDIGKLDVPHEILNKPSLPNPEEWAMIQQHPIAAERYLAPLQGWLGEWSKAATDHHLRWDGKGYPRTVGGTDISYAGRLVAIADAYDVMTSARSYKDPLSPADARAELLRCAGGQFDPQLVRSFLNIGLRPVRLAGGALAVPALLSAVAGGVASTVGRFVLATSAVTTGVAAVPLMHPTAPSQTAEIAVPAEPIALPSVTPTPLAIPPLAIPPLSAESATVVAPTATPTASESPVVEAVLVARVRTARPTATPPPTPTPTVAVAAVARTQLVPTEAQTRTLFVADPDDSGASSTEATQLADAATPTATPIPLPPQTAVPPIPLPPTAVPAPPHPTSAPVIATPTTVTIRPTPTSEPTYSSATPTVVVVPLEPQPTVIVIETPPTPTVVEIPTTLPEPTPIVLTPPAPTTIPLTPPTPTAVVMNDG